MPDLNASKIDFSVEILGNTTDGFYATVTPQGQKAKHADHVVWYLDVIPKDFPKKATIFLQFVVKSGETKTNVNGPLLEAVNGRIDAQNKTISGTVSTGGTSCYYGLHYEESPGKSKELIDPELVVEGSDSTPLIKFMKARQKELVAILRAERNKKKPAKGKKATKAKSKKAKKAKKR